MLFQISKGHKFCGKKQVGIAFYSIKQYIPEVVSNRDLYICNQKLNTNKRVQYDGFGPSFYNRSFTDFQSDYLDFKDLGDIRILEVLAMDKEFDSKIKPRTDRIQNFLGEEFPLHLNEMIAILCGLSNFNVDIQSYASQSSISQDLTSNSPSTLSSSKLRLIGKSIFELHIGLSTVFATQKYLSLSSEEIESNFDMFKDEKSIPIFMRNNLIYNCIIPFRGAMKWGPLHSLEEYEIIKKKITDASSIGSFYTMIGLLITKFDKEKVINDIIYHKIIEGPSGIVNLVTENFLKIRP